MPSLNFQARFAPLVESGEKRQTIRANRKRPIKVGDTLYLYTGLRSPGARLLTTAVCSEAWTIELRQTQARPEILFDGKPLSWNGLGAHALAVRDGFENILELLAWFERTHGFPFRGQVIRW